MAIETVDVDSGTGISVAVDTISGAEYQVVKVSLGADGEHDTLVDSGQQTMANSVPVAIASDQTALSVSATSLDIRTLVHTSDSVTVGDGTNVATVRGLMANNALNVAVVDASGDHVTSFGGGTQYTEGDSDPTITGTAIMYEGAAEALVPPSSSAPLPVTLYGVGGQASVNPTTGAVNVEATDLDIRDLTSTSDSILVYGSDDGGTTKRVLKTDDTGSLAIDIESAPTLTVEATSLDIRALSPATDNVMVSGSYDSGVSSAYIMTDRDGRLQVDMKGTINGAQDKFGHIVTGEINNQIDIQFYSAVEGTDFDSVTLTGSGSRLQDYSQLLLSTGATAGSAAWTKSPGTVMYTAGAEVYCIFTAAFGNIAGSSTGCYQRIGLFSATNGFWIGVEEGEFGCGWRSFGADYFEPLSSVNGDTLAAGLTSKYTRGGVPEALDPSKMNVFRIRFGWVGSAPIDYEILSPDGEWVRFHSVRQPNTSEYPSIASPVLPVRAEVYNGAETEDLTLSTNCWAAGTSAAMEKLSATLDADTTYARVTRSVVAGENSSGNLTNVEVDNLGALNVNPEASIVLDTLNATTGWAAANTDCANLATTTVHVLGTAALTFDKANTAANSNSAMIAKTLDSVNLGSISHHDTIQTVVYLSSITNVAYVFLRLGTNANNYNEWRIPDTELTAGVFQTLLFSVGAPAYSGVAGNGWNPSDIDYIALGVEFDAETNTLTGIIFDEVSYHNGLHTSTSLTAQISSSVSTPNVRLNGYTASTPTGGGVESGALRVTIANDSTGVLSIDDNNSSITVDGSVTEASGAAIKTAVEIMDDWDETDRAKVNLIVGQAGITAGAGTVAVNTPRTTLASDDPAVTALQIMDDWDESDRAKVNLIVGQAGITAGAGAVATNTPRVTHASDDPVTTSVQIMDDWDESDRAKVNLIVGQAGVTAGAGAVAANTPRVTHASDDPVTTSVQLLDDAVYADDDDWTNTTSKHINVGGVYQAAPVTNVVTDGDVSPIQVNKLGSLRVGVLEDELAGNTTCVNKYYTNAGAVTDGIVWSPAAGKRWYVTDIIINVSAAATVTLEDDLISGDTAVFKVELAANSGISHSFKTPMFSGEDAADLMVTTSAGNVYITVTGYEV